MTVLLQIVHTSSHERFYFPPGPKQLRVRRVRSRTAAESVYGLDVKQSLSQPTKYIPLTVHKAPSSRNCQQHRMRELSSHGGWYYHTKPSYDGKIVSFVEVESLGGATGYPLRTPRLEDTVLDAHTREPITVIKQKYLVVLRFCR